MKNTDYSIQKAQCCDTVYPGTYTGRHLQSEDQHFNFSTPNSFLNHFTEENPLFVCRDLIVNYSQRVNNVAVCVNLFCKRTNTEKMISASGPTIPSAFVQILIKMDI
jgi:hypothetical protein